MPEQKRVDKTKTEEKQVVEEEEGKVASKTPEEIKAETDDLLAAIDEALGDELLANAQAFVEGFQQKGGQ